MDPAIIGVLIPIVGIAAIGGVALAKIFVRHRERMAMIEAGFHPDDPDFEAAEDPERLTAGDRQTIGLSEPGRVGRADD